MLCKDLSSEAVWSIGGGATATGGTLGAAAGFMRPAFVSEDSRSAVPFAGGAEACV